MRTWEIALSERAGMERGDACLNCVIEISVKFVADPVQTFRSCLPHADSTCHESDHTSTNSKVANMVSKPRTVDRA